MFSTKISSNEERKSKKNISKALSKNMLGDIVEFLNLYDLETLSTINKKFNKSIKIKTAVKKEDAEPSQILDTYYDFLEERKKLFNIKEVTYVFNGDNFSYFSELRHKLIEKKFSCFLVDNFIKEIMESLAHALKVNQTVISNDLQGNFLGENAENLKKLGDALKANQRLRTLNLSSNYLGIIELNLYNLEKALRINHTLCTLDLSKNSLRKHELNLRIFADVLRVNKTLTTLYLSGNCLGEVESNLIYLADALKKNQKLSKLDISNNFLGNKTANSILISFLLKDNTKL